MSRHTERDNLVLLTISLEVDGVVAFVTIKDEKTIGTGRFLLYRSIKVL
jgi:hypothetical protein